MIQNSKYCLDNSLSKTNVSAPSVFLMAISFILLWIEYVAKANNPKSAIKITMKFNKVNKFLCLRKDAYSCKCDTIFWNGPVETLLEFYELVR